MWQRFTDRARKVVFFAHEAAMARGEVYVSTEHLLPGLIREDDSTVTKMLSKFGLTRDAVKAAVKCATGSPASAPNSAQGMQLTPHARRAVDFADDEARGFNHNYIGAEHLLLGLLREGEGIAAEALLGLGLELEPLREAARALIPENAAATKTVRTLTGQTPATGAASPLQPQEEPETPTGLFPVMPPTAHLALPED